MRMRLKSPKTLTATAAIGLIAAGTALAAPGPADAAAAAAPGTQVTGTLANGTVWIAEYPKSWNGTLILYSHGFGPLTAADAPDPNTQAALLADGYALAGSSYDPNNSEWALDTAVSDQFGTLAAVESTVLPARPKHVLAFGTSMGGLVSALEAQQGAGKIDGALTTCGIVGGGVNLNEYQIDGEYAIAQLLGNPGTQLVGFGDDPTALGTAAALTADAAQAQSDGRRAGPAGAGDGLPQRHALGPVRGRPGGGQRPGGAGGRRVQRAVQRVVHHHGLHRARPDLH